MLVADVQPGEPVAGDGSGRRPEAAGLQAERELHCKQSYMGGERSDVSKTVSFRGEMKERNSGSSSQGSSAKESQREPNPRVPLMCSLMFSAISCAT